jgi:hypothetical protein
MGKSTAVKLYAASSPLNWSWISFTDLEANQISSVLRKLIIYSDQSKVPPYLILDDLDISSSPVAHLNDILGDVWSSTRDRGGKIIITSQTKIASNYLEQWDLNPDSNLSASALDYEEISELANALGCQEDISKTWAPDVYRQTKGHPQLVHAYLRSVKKDSWTPPPEKGVGVPMEVKQELAEVRKQLVSKLPTEQIELLDRLGFVPGPFRLDQVLAIGEIEPSLSRPGDIFESLLGPWIESTTRNYFTLSPLLRNSGSGARSNLSIQILCKKIAEAISGCGKYSQWECRTLILLGIKGKANDILVRSILGALAAPSDIWKELGNELSFVLNLGDTEGKKIYESDDIVNGFFRMLQFRIAVEISPEIAGKFYAVFEREVTKTQVKVMTDLQKFMFNLLIVMNFRVPFSISRLLEILQNIFRYSKTLNDLEDPESRAMPDFRGNEKMASHIPALFTLIVPRCNNSTDLCDLIESIEAWDEDLRNIVISSLKLDDPSNLMLIDQVWTNESTKTEPNWKDCISAFKRTLDFSRRFRCIPLAHAASRGTAIIFEEYLNEPEAAKSVVAEVVSEFGDSDILKDELATISFHHKEYSRAKQIWDSFLSNWRPSPDYINTTPMLSCRKAAIASANLGSWDAALSYFRLGYSRSLEINQFVFEIGFLADSGFALWKLGRYKEMLDVFLTVHERLLVNQDFENNPQIFKVAKLFGYIILWIEREISGHPMAPEGEVRAGLCSNPEKSEALIDLPRPDLGLLATLLSEIESHTKTGDKVYRHVLSKYGNSKKVVIRFILADLSVYYCIQRLEFENIPSVLNDSLLSIINSKESRTKVGGGSHLDEWILDKVPENVSEEDFRSIGRTMSMAILAANCAHRDILSLFIEWKNYINENKLNSLFINLIQKAEIIYKMDMRIFYNAKLTDTFDSDSKIISWIRISSAEDLPLALVIVSQYFLARTIMENRRNDQISEFFYVFMTNYWKERLKNIESGLSGDNYRDQVIRLSFENSSNRLKMVKLIRVILRKIEISMNPADEEWLRSNSV